MTSFHFIVSRSIIGGIASFLCCVLSFAWLVSVLVFVSVCDVEGFVFVGGISSCCG